MKQNSRKTMPAAGTRGWPFFDPHYVPAGTTTETSIEIMGGERGGGSGDSVDGNNDSSNGAAVLTVVCPFRVGVHLQVLEALESMQLDASRAKLAFEGGYVLDELDVPSGITDETVLRFTEGSLMGLSDSGAGCGKALSRLAAVLAELRCNVAALVAWTRRGDRAACLLLLVDAASHQPVQEKWRRDQILSRLRSRKVTPPPSPPPPPPPVIRTGSGGKPLLQGIVDAILDLVTSASGGYTSSSPVVFDRRPGEPPCVTARVCEQWKYVEVQVQLRDHPGLLLRSVRALADLGYQIFHASADRKLREEEQQMEALELVYAQKLDGSVPDEVECRSLERMLQALLAGENASRKKVEVAPRAGPDEDCDEKVFWDGNLLAVSFTRGCYWSPSISSGGKHFLNLFYISSSFVCDEIPVREKMEQAKWDFEAKY